ncbi:MAG: ABC transporter ATP-binding protein [Parachlamydiaceae bacterium]|nr:ABC transporter ATP-binding protein [Parachlamydiaceae bacterium]
MNSDIKTLLQAKNISKNFKYPSEFTLFNDISLDVLAGESVAIVGRSGEGKSTLLQIFGTLEDATSGILAVEGIEVTRSNRAHIRNEKIGFVFQSFHLLEDYTALENVLMPAKIAGKSLKKDSAAYKRGWELLKMVGLEERAHFHTKLLSGGEKQRVALARAMCNDPSLILADEPSGNLDHQTAELIHDILLNFAVFNKGLLIVTHDRELARLCTRQYELKSGQLIPLL